MSDEISHEEQAAWIQAYNDNEWMEGLNLDWDGAEVAVLDRPVIGHTQTFVSPALSTLDPSRDPSVHLHEPVPCLDLRLSAGSFLPQRHDFGFLDSACGNFSMLTPDNHGLDIIDNTIVPSLLDENVALGTLPNGDDNDGPRAADPQASRIRMSRKHLHGAIDRKLRCLEDNCDYPGTFPREYELERHIATKHQPLKQFMCPAVGCFKGASASRFARSDKLTSHIIATHTADKLMRCVSPGCTVENLPLDLMVAHTRLAHEEELNRDRERGSAQLRALDNALKPVLKRCLHWRCQTGQGSGRNASFAEHALTHAPDELRDMRDTLVDHGYRLTEVATDSGGHAHNLAIICPICEDENLYTDEDFAQHIVERHLLVQSDGNLAHWRSWHVYVRSKQHVKDGTKHKSRYPWKSWSFGAYDRKLDIKCPSCADRFSKKYSFERGHIVYTHHFQFLRKEADVVAELYPHRREILRKFPDFCDHPVFNDLKRTTPVTGPASPEIDTATDKTMVIASSSGGH